MPGISARIPASTSATPIRMEVCASWPQACITPHSWPFHGVTALLAKGTSTSSFTGQRVHVGAQRHHGAGLAALEDAHDAGHGDLLAHLVQAQRAQVLRDEPRGAHLAVAELGMLVQVAPPGDDLRLHAVGGGGEGGIEAEGGVGSVHGGFRGRSVVNGHSSPAPRL